MPKHFFRSNKEKKNGERSLRQKLQSNQKPSIKNGNNKKTPLYLVQSTFHSIKFIKSLDDLFMKIKAYTFWFLISIFMMIKDHHNLKS